MKELDLGKNMALLREYIGNAKFDLFFNHLELFIQKYYYLPNIRKLSYVILRTKAKYYHLETINNFGELDHPTYFSLSNKIIHSLVSIIELIENNFDDLKGNTSQKNGIESKFTKTTATIIVDKEYHSKNIDIATNELLKTIQKRHPSAECKIVNISEGSIIFTFEIDYNIDLIHYIKTLETSNDIGSLKKVSFNNIYINNYLKAIVDAELITKDENPDHWNLAISFMHKKVQRLIKENKFLFNQNENLRDVVYRSKFHGEIEKENLLLSEIRKIRTQLHESMHKIEKLEREKQKEDMFRDRSILPDDGNDNLVNVRSRYEDLEG